MDQSNNCFIAQSINEVLFIRIDNSYVQLCKENPKPLQAGRNYAIPY